MEFCQGRGQSKQGQTDQVLLDPRGTWCSGNGVYYSPNDKTFCAESQADSSQTARAGLIAELTARAGLTFWWLFPTLGDRRLVSGISSLMVFPDCSRLVSCSGSSPAPFRLNLISWAQFWKILDRLAQPVPRHSSLEREDFHLPVAWEVVVGKVHCSKLQRAAQIVGLHLQAPLHFFWIRKEAGLCISLYSFPFWRWRLLGTISQHHMNCPGCLLSVSVST